MRHLRFEPARSIRSKVEVKAMPLPNGDYAAKYTVSATESSSDASQTSRAVLEPHSCRGADQGQVVAAGRPANRASIQEIWSLTESPITCPGSTLG
jgi:hypothetical protein